MAGDFSLFYHSDTTTCTTWPCMKGEVFGFQSRHCKQKGFFFGKAVESTYLCDDNGFRYKKSFYAEDFLIFWIIFYFYSNEHEPIHVHVLHGARESVFELIMMNGELVEVRVREKKGAEPLPEKDRRTVEEFIRKYQKNIIDKWVKFFVLKQSIRSTNIKKRI